MCFAAPAHPCAMAEMQKDCRNNPCRRITRTLMRAGVLVEDPEQPWLDLEPGSTLEHLATALLHRDTERRGSHSNEILTPRNSCPASRARSLY